MNFNGSWYCIRFYATQSLLSRETAREPRNLFCPIVQITGTNEQNSKKKNATAHPYFGHVRVEWLYKHRYTVPESEKKKKRRKNEATGYLRKFLRPRLTEKNKDRDNAVNLVTLWWEKESWDLCSELLHLTTNFFKKYYYRSKEILHRIVTHTYFRNKFYPSWN